MIVKGNVQIIEGRGIPLDIQIVREDGEAGLDLTTAKEVYLRLKNVVTEFSQRVDVTMVIPLNVFVGWIRLLDPSTIVAGFYTYVAIIRTQLDHRLIIHNQPNDYLFTVLPAIPDPV